MKQNIQKFLALPLICFGMMALFTSAAPCGDSCAYGPGWKVCRTVKFVCTEEIDNPMVWVKKCQTPIIDTSGDPCVY